ncbi:MAG: response regulator transcription factor [Flavobacteriales bacterium]|nr:response regulator transcription factor [Flavobacteriales bacterium]
MPHSIALVDDHDLMRSALANMIDRLGDYKVIFQASNGKQFVEGLPTDDAPLIAIVDLNMPVMDGYQVLEWLSEHRRDVRALVLTFDATDDALTQAVRLGARGFLGKNARPPLLKLALDSIALTGYFQSGDTSGHAPPPEAMSVARYNRERDHILSRMTDRELEFLQLVCSEEEHTYPEIGRRMDLRPRSVDNYRISLFQKFDIKSKTGLVLFAMKWRLLEG